MTEALQTAEPVELQSLRLIAQQLQRQFPGSDPRVETAVCEVASSLVLEVAVTEHLAKGPVRKKVLVRCEDLRSQRYSSLYEDGTYACLGSLELRGYSAEQLKYLLCSWIISKAFLA